MGLITELSELELLDATVNDVVTCDTEGCTRVAKWRSKCRDCDSSTVLLCEPCKQWGVDLLKQKQSMGVIIKCVESKLMDKPLKMVLFIPLPGKP